MDHVDERFNGFSGTATGLAAEVSWSPIYLTTDLSLTSGGYSGFQVTGMLEWGKKSTPPPKKKKKIPGPEAHAEFFSRKNFQKALNYITLCFLFGCTLFAELRGRDTQALPQIFRLFWIPQKIPTWIKPPKKIQNRVFILLIRRLSLIKLILLNL